MKSTTEKVIYALRVMDMDADKLFHRIRNDLERGLVKEARSHLNFVDKLLNEKTAHQWNIMRCMK